MANVGMISAKLNVANDIKIGAPPKTSASKPKKMMDTTATASKGLNAGTADNFVTSDAGLGAGGGQPSGNGKAGGLDLRA